ncbi:MAG: protoporphyrinogen oxidase [Acidobacteriota bacterium]|nr:protoporphyrinogen oxidase [Acidobacteriota bacterium]
MRLVVIGGGVSGLTAAWVAARADPALEVLVLERGSVVGGKARTFRDGDWRVECGPTGFLAPDENIERLLSETGLDASVVSADEAAAHRFVVRGGRVREVSPHPIKFLGSGILGPLGAARALAEPFVGRRKGDGDESVWHFASRRVGRQAADRLAAPMVLGVFAGDARRLSLAAAFPRLAELETDHGSLVRGVLARGREVRAGARARTPPGKLTSLSEGMGALCEALGEGPFELRRGRPVDVIQPCGGGYSVRVAGDDISADAVVLACEAFAAGNLVEAFAPSLAGELSAISYPPVSVVGLGFEGSAWAGVPHGFGVLVPRGEGLRTLGFLWESHIFPGRSPRQCHLLRAMVGGAVDPEATSLSDEELVALVRSEAQALLAIEEEPVFRHVHRWERAIPQYEVGHPGRVGRIEAELNRLPGLFMAGNSLRGIAFGKAVAAGITAAEDGLEFLALHAGQGRAAQ